MRAVFAVLVLLLCHAASSAIAQPVFDLAQDEHIDLLRQARLVEGGAVAPADLPARLAEFRNSPDAAGTVGIAPSASHYLLHARLTNTSPRQRVFVLRVRPETIGPVGALLADEAGRPLYAGGYAAPSPPGLPELLSVPAGGNFVIELPAGTTRELLVGIRADNAPGWLSVTLLPEPVFSQSHENRRLLGYSLLALLLFLGVQTLFDGLSGQRAALWYTIYALDTFVFWAFTYSLTEAHLGWFDYGHVISRVTMIVAPAMLLLFQRDVLDLKVHRPRLARVMTLMAFYCLVGAVLQVVLTPQLGALMMWLFYTPYIMLVTVVSVLTWRMHLPDAKLLAFGWGCYLTGLLPGLITGYAGAPYMDEILTYVSIGQMAEILIFILVLRLRILRLRADKVRAETEARSWQRFIGTVSHDLRQPVQALRLLDAAAAHGQPAHGRPAQGQTMQSRAAVSALSDMLDDLSELGRLEAGTVAPQHTPVALDSLLREIAEELRPEAESLGIRLRLQPSSMVISSHPLLLRRMLRNLVVNALRHAGSRDVLVGCRRSGGMLRLMVYDRGRGIAADRLTRLLDGDNPAGGLGLAIVARLSRLLGHRFDAVSQPGRGSAFWIELVPA